MDALAIGVGNLVAAYETLAAEGREEFQYPLDKTKGLAVRSLRPVPGQNHEILRKLKTTLAGPLPASVHDFQKRTWFQAQIGPHHFPYQEP